MRRQGFPALGIIVAMIVLLIGVTIIGASSADILGQFGQQTNDSAGSSDLRTCETAAKNYCISNPDGDWGTIYEDCTAYADVIDDGDTACPLGSVSEDGSEDGSE